METDLEEDIIGYNIEQQQQSQYYYNDDAEFLADDQIANLVYQHDEQGNIIQEMQPQRQFYAARTMPNLEFYEEEEEYIIEEEPSSSQQPLVSVEAAQTLLSNKLDDLTEKLTFIKNNIIQIRPTAEEDDDDDENYDKTTLHTIHREDQESHSDIDSITSEALDVYEDTNNKQQPQQQSRYSTDELHLPSMANFVSDQHPFSYFTDPEQQQEQEQQEDGINVRNVFDIGRKWLGV